MTTQCKLLRHKWTTADNHVEFCGECGIHRSKFEKEYTKNGKVGKFAGFKQHKEPIVLKDNQTKGTILEGEYHPAADSAMAYVRGQMAHIQDWTTMKEAVASTALSGNRLSEILLETIERLEKGEPVSDRYLLGLAWVIQLKK